MGNVALVIILSFLQNSNEPQFEMPAVGYGCENAE
jgi:hypothetical protein